MVVRLNLDDDVATITIDRAEAHNALNEDVIRRIGVAIDDVARSNARALVFLGAGQKAFCAGADIKEIEGRSVADQRAAAVFGQRTFAKLDHLAIPSVAAIHGFTLGGGLELAMACTFRVATQNAKMGLPEIKLGLIPGYGGTQRLPRLVGVTKALEMILTGCVIDAREAERIGLVNRVVEEEQPEKIACDFARCFTTLSRTANDCARHAVLAAMQNPLDAGLEIEAEMLARAFATSDASEGIAAFLEKRQPQFNLEAQKPSVAI